MLIAAKNAKQLKARSAPPPAGAAAEAEVQLDKHLPEEEDTQEV
jgi:hypothetical protein